MISSVVRDRGTGDAATPSLVMLEAETQYARERYQLYSAKAYGSRLTSPGRLRELERKSKLADSRLDRAKADQEPLASVDDQHLP